MPYLYCEQHGREHEARSSGHQDEYRQLDETVLVVNGTLNGGPWLCDKCNVELRKGMPALLVTAFPSHCRDALHDYDFAYELNFFAMAAGDRVTAYGAEWPDDSLSMQRRVEAVRRGKRSQPRPISATELMSKK